MTTTANFTAPARPTPWRVTLAWVAVVLTPAELVVGFVMGYAIGLDPSIENPVTGWDAAWRVVVLWLIVAAMSIVGMLLSWSARRHHESTATAALIVNAVVMAALTAITLVPGLIDAFG